MRLLLLLLPLGLFADVNLLCGNAVWKITDDIFEETDHEYVVTINERLKKVTVPDYENMRYEEKGAELTFRAAVKVQNKNGLTVFTLNRISGVLLEENWISDAEYDDMDEVERFDTKGHIEIFTYKLQCEKVEPLF